MRERRQTAGQFLGGGDVNRALRQEGAQQPSREFQTFPGDGLEFAAGLSGGKPERFALFAINEPAKFDVVGQEQVRQRTCSFLFDSVTLKAHRSGSPKL